MTTTETKQFNLANPAPIYDAVHNSLIETLKTPAVMWCGPKTAMAAIEVHDAEIADLEAKLAEYNARVAKGCQDDEKAK